MKLNLRCPECGTTLGVDESLLGRQVRCTNCQAVFTAEAQPGMPSEPSPESFREGPARESEGPREERVRDRPDEVDDRPARPPRYDDYADDDDDFDRPRRRRPTVPHRGGSVLAMGIGIIVASCLCAFIGIGLGSGAVNMANKDLQQMDEGWMDRSGRGQTQAGKVCGIIGVVLGVIFLILTCLIRIGNIGNIK